MTSSFQTSALKADLNQLSKFLGDNLEWVQGAGGNTSVKDNGVLWIKASGLWLTDAQKSNIFTPLKQIEVLDKISKDQEDLSSARIVNSKYDNLRPSIETTLHSLMPHKFVIHVHSVNVLAHAILTHGKKIIEKKLKGVNWLWVPYVRPGLPLSQSLKKLDASRYDVLILANHGIVIGASTKSEVINRLHQIEDKLYCPIERNYEFLDLEILASKTKNTKYKLPRHEFCHSIALDSFSHELILKNPLYPDHVIFIGPGPMKTISLDSLLNGTLNKISDKVVIVKDIGILVHDELSDNGEEILHCLASVLLRCTPEEKINHLNSEQELELLGWDAEKYRKLIQR